MLDCIAPSYCLLCGAWGSWVCESCNKKLPRARQTICPACFEGFEGVLCKSCRKNNSFDALSFPFFFEPPLSNLMHFYKYRGLVELSNFFGSAINETLRYYPFSDRWIIIPVPLHPTRKRERGFNQAEMLAREISRTHTIKMETRALRRIHRTEMQATLSKTEREKNLVGIFRAHPKLVKEKNIILVDDVATTLSTLNACARTLKTAGAACIWAVVAARTP